jgi:hypothetical protein
MRLFKWFRGGAVALASVGMLIPQMALGVEARGSRPAETRSVAAPVVRDVALQAGGVLRGQVLDTQGTPAAKTHVVLGQAGQQIAETQTDAQGRFSFGGLKGGVYQLATAQGGAVYRAWAVGTAPPAASADALVINGDTVVRGGMGGGGGGGLISFLANPFVLGAIVVAAVAVPVVVAQQNEGS